MRIYKNKQNSLRFMNKDVKRAPTEYGSIPHKLYDKKKIHVNYM